MSEGKNGVAKFGEALNSGNVWKHGHYVECKCGAWNARDEWHITTFKNKCYRCKRDLFATIDVTQFDPPSDLLSVLINVAQVFDGWHADGTAWSQWDEEIRQQVSGWIKKLSALPTPDQPTTKP